MPPTPRISIWGACRSLALRTRTRTQTQCSSIAAAAPSSFARQYSDDVTTPQPPTPSSGSASWSKARGSNDEMKGSQSTPSFGTGSSLPNIPSDMLRPGEGAPQAPVSPEEVMMRQPTPEEIAHQQLQLTSVGVNPFDSRLSQFTGLKFEEPVVPVGKPEHTQFHMKHRYDEGIAQLTRLLMRHGKLSKAQNDMAMVLNFLRTSPAPKLNPQRPLLPGAPPPEQLPLNPVFYLMLIVDSVAPLVRVRGFPGLSGGGKALEFPVPIHKRARRRMAFQWIMDAVEKRTSMGSGKKMLAHRIGEELIAVAEGRSPVWDKRQQLHKMGVSVRANLNSPMIGRRQIPVSMG